MGRAAYQEPWRLLAVDPLLFGEAAPYGFAQGTRPKRSSLHRARTCPRRAAACHHAARARAVPRRARRARVPPASCDRGREARCGCRDVPRRRWRWCWTSLRHRCKPPRPDPDGPLGPSCLAGHLRSGTCCSACRSASLLLLAGLIIVAGVRHRRSGRPVRHRRRRADRAGALRGLPAARRAGRR